ncbi:MAG: AI-2E family transporter [Chloroflexota bacterium]|nr:AI-2E family transporter [Chloroflexota bacterium]
MTPPPITSPAWSTRTKRIILISVAILLALALWRLNEALPLLILSVLLAYLFNPVTTFLEKRVTRYLPGARNWAIFLTIIGAISVFIIVILVIFPVLFNQLEEFGNRLPRLAASLQTSVEEFLSRPIIINNQPLTIDGEPLIPLDQLRELNGGEDLSIAQQLGDLNLVELTRQFVNSLTGPAINVVGGALSFVINAIFLLTLLFYWLKDGGRFADNLVDITPLSYQNDMRRLLYELGRVWNAYLRGQLLLATFIGVTVFSVATILGVPNAPTLGLISGVLEFIPTLGPLIAIFPAILLALGSQSATLPFLEGAPFALVVIVAWVTIQNVQAIIVAPRVMGSRLNLHPVVVIIGVIFGASLAGALGIILAAPTIASLRALGQYIYGKLTDTNPFPAVVAIKSHESPGRLTLLRDRAWEFSRRWGMAGYRWLQERLTRKPATE